MPSDLQEPFLNELAVTCKATAKRIAKRLEESSSRETEEIVTDELRGLFHGLLVVFDGGTALAEKGLVRIIDENGIEFDRNLHENCFEHWSQ